MLISTNTYVLADSSKPETNFYNMANDIFYWHDKEKIKIPLVLKKTQGTQVKLTTSGTSVPNKLNTNLEEKNLHNSIVTTAEDHQSKKTNINKTVELKSVTQPDSHDLSQKLPNYRQVKPITDKYLQELEKNSTQFVKWQKKVASDKNLPNYSSDVAYLKTDSNFLLDNDDQQLKIVPLVNIGTENSINSNDIISDAVTNFKIEYKTPNKLETPSMLSRTEFLKFKTQVNKLYKTKKLKRKKWELGNVVSSEEIDSVAFELVNELKFQAHAVEALSKYDVFMLSALIFKRKKLYPLALGLFDEITQSEKYKQEANYHLGEIAYKLKLYTEATHRLLPLVTKPNPYRVNALAILFDTFPKEHEKRISLAISKMENKETVPPLFLDKIYYFVAKSQFDDHNFQSAKYSAAQVSKESELFDNAQFIKGLSEYLSQDLTNAVQTLSQLQIHLERTSKEENNIASLVALNLGRVFFQLKKFKQAYHSYKRINKSHPLWVQAVTELGWVQLAMGDQFGAIGNMYSMHSPYFKAVYKPETFSIKTIGYLNICQYADAYKSMTVHEKKYRAWHKDTAKYLASASSEKVYKTVVKYLAGQSTLDVDGLPYQITREIARQKDFLNTQNDINSKIDESRSYAKALSSFNLNNKKASEKLKKYKEKLKKTKDELALAQKQKNSDNIEQSALELQSMKEYVTAYYFQLRLYDHSKKKLRVLRNQSKKRIKNENLALVKLAGQQLHKHLKQVHTDNGNLLDNNELLRYEIFSGSGENIRFQVSGGQVKNENRIPASVKPKKALNWDFSGEYWEDEIGNYRTTLVDKCPK